MPNFSIVPYEPQHQPRFYALNEAWISRWYAMEEEDKRFLADPVRYIIAPGGALFCLLGNGGVMGVCGIMKMDEGVYELVRMAVDESARGKGYGEALLKHAIGWAKSQNARQVILETGEHNKTAVRLYERLGFEHYTPDPKYRSGLARASVFMRLKTDAAAAA